MTTFSPLKDEIQAFIMNMVRYDSDEVGRTFDAELKGEVQGTRLEEQEKISLNKENQSSTLYIGFHAVFPINLSHAIAEYPVHTPPPY